MVKNKNEIKTAVSVKDLVEPTMMESVEGTYQCMGCQRFMRLGEGRLCVTLGDDVPAIAEIIGWVPGDCERYIETEKLI